MRDYLISVIIVDSASRCGAVSNMRLEEFENAFSSKDGIGVIVPVKRHKTAYMFPTSD